MFWVKHNISASSSIKWDYDALKWDGVKVN